MAKRLPLTVCAVLCLGILLAPVWSAAATASWDDIQWFDGASGYAEAVAEAESTGASVLVYFYTDWCPYCRQLNNSLLGAPEVQAELDGMLAVRVNAEAGPGERSLAAHYSVRGYPALYVYDSAQGGRFQPIRRTVSADSGGVRLKTPEEFVATLRAAAR